MDPESKQLLERTFELVEENNEMLHKVRRVQKRAAVFQAVRWIVIIGISVGAFYFLQPYIEQIKLFANQTSNAFNQIKGMMPN